MSEKQVILSLVMRLIAFFGPTLLLFYDISQSSDPSAGAVAPFAVIFFFLPMSLSVLAVFIMGILIYNKFRK